MRSTIENPENTISFSVSALWEISIKRAGGRKDSTCDPRLLQRNAMSAGYLELGSTGDHTLQVGALPLLHRDPFDRILIARAQVEGSRRADGRLARPAVSESHTSLVAQVRHKEPRHRRIGFARFGQAHVIPKGMRQTVKND